METKNKLIVTGAAVAGLLTLAAALFHKRKPAGTADIELSDLILEPNQALEGDGIIVSCKATNHGTVSGSYEIILGGDFMASQNVTLGPGQSKTVQFSLTAPAPGDYVIQVGDLQGSLHVAPAPFTDFVFSNLQISPNSVYPGDTVNVSVTVKNNGNTSGQVTVDMELGG